MRVVDKVIFCEGNLDLGLLNKVVENQFNNITIVAAGGKFSFSTFIQGYFSSVEENKQDKNNERKNQDERKKSAKKYITFRDRDFDTEPTSEIKLLQIDKLGNRSFLSHRTCIENYLLEPELIHQYWITKYEEQLENPISRWGHKDSPGIDKITQWIEEAAKNLQAYQAVRWALGNLCQLSANRQQLKTKWTENTIPDSLDLSNCKSEALSLINEFKNTVEEVTIDKFEESLSKYLQLFNQQEFWQQKQYLIWFNGKDIYKAMHKISQDKTRPYKSYISMDKFSKWAVNNIDINQYPDLIELRNKIEQL
ncbi:hypothetical protein PN497_06125 [Sphaerospermopsis kisseleviana CS-549]|uniref:DUF4435 domain-containing protein n=1 Tax=Sphaerospermopsis kisseleviana CS-549 TaxID=3021783 RepID=A0ABT4ZNH0_9CYAN|nr:hypothetical protein [Sphaerospermopsis kisseleviana]MDB9440943.1 hypothetical protein [Sphaerospermopsis kisseleviana CS-549]BAZ79839.1 hypothetical protein NIES73_10850 [Sphaerospermopsis kisseleviana NIES-73]